MKSERTGKQKNRHHDPVFSMLNSVDNVSSINLDVEKGLVEANSSRIEMIDSPLQTLPEFLRLSPNRTFSLVSIELNRIRT